MERIVHGYKIALVEKYQQFKAKYVNSFTAHLKNGGDGDGGLDGSALLISVMTCNDGYTTLP